MYQMWPKPIKLVPKRAPQQFAVQLTDQNFKSWYSSVDNGVYKCTIQFRCLNMKVKFVYI